MSEHIELKTIRTLQRNQSDSDQYHEISNEALQETISSPKRAITTVQEYDFFTQYDTGTLRKQSSHKKKSKKTKKPKTFLDVVSSELGGKQNIIENNITVVNYDKERASCLEKKLRICQILKLKVSRNADIENRLDDCKSTNISPIFPRVLENNVTKKTSIPIQYIEPSLFSDVVTEYLESTITQAPKFLDITLKDIKFQYHHKFSLEKLCALKLIEYYKKYDHTTKLLQRMIKEIDINRRTRDGLRERLIEINPNKKDDIRYDKNILKYTKTMLQLKEEYYGVIREQKDIINKIKSLWADIELIRERSGVTKTDSIIEIIEMETEQEEFEKQWHQTFEMEYSDMIIKIEYEFINRYLEYKELKRFHNGRNIAKPKLEIDYDKLKIDVESLVNSIVSRNRVDLLLKRDRSIISYENSRRKSIANNYYFKVYVDDVFVCESDQYVFTDDNIEVDFTERLSIEILPHNEFLSIVLIENDEDMSLFKIQLSDIKKKSSDMSLKQCFVFNKIMEPNTKYVGSGYDIKEIANRNKVRLKSANIFKGKLWTRCEVNIQLGWNNKYNDNQLEAIKSCMNVRRQLKQLLHGKNTPCINKVKEIINNLYDNNIEENQNIMTALKDICKSVIKENHSFNLDKNSSELIRFKLLHLRSNGGFLDLENTAIPLFTSQMSTELLSCLERKRNDDYHNFKKETENHSIDVQRFMGLKFIQKLNNNLMKKVNDHLLKVTYKDVVRDYEDVSLRNIFSTQSNSSLGAVTSLSKQQLLKDCLMKDQEIYVTVFRAYNLMDKSSIIIENENYADNIAGFKVHPLRPFVQVCYHNEYARTNTAIGRHPTWNLTIKIKTRLEPLSSIHVHIYDQCKENITETYADEKSVQSTVVYRKYNEWLGSVNIPMHTILSLGNISGTFKLNHPPLLFGYENLSQKQSESTYSEVRQMMVKETPFLALQISTSLSHFGGSQTYRQPVTDESENDCIIRRLNEFVTDYVNEFPSRNISLTFIDSAGSNKCVSEFLQAVPIPDVKFFPLDPKKTESALSKSSGYSRSSSRSSRRKSLTEDRESVSFDWKLEESVMKYIDAVVRYVSLIPTYEMTESYAVTLTGVELLKVLYGSPLDHTILLASYLLYLEIKCWIVIGYGLPRGLSSYVLVQYYQNKLIKMNEQVKTRGICGGSEEVVWYIYDAVAGERYDLRERGCPLRTVSYVFDPENIWVNVQTSQDCECVSFDLSKSADWRTVFNKPLYYTKTINDSLYSKPLDVESLRLTLETKIRAKIQKWRSRVKTIWNKHCSNLLREMLPHWEYWSFNTTTPPPSAGNRLKQLMATYKIFGFPLNMSYLNAKLIIARIKSTEIHVNDDPNVEFGLGVEIYAYPNNVLSVWVFLANIIRI